MESLALVVSILVLICFFSGPIGFFLTSRILVQTATHRLVFLIRRIFVIVNGLLGSIVSTFFLVGPIPALLKAISLLSLLMNIWALDREFGSPLYRYLRENFRKKNE